MTKTISTTDVVIKSVPLASEIPFLWTLDRYHHAIETGVFTEDDKVELLFGQIVPKMPVGEPHADCVGVLMTHFILKYKREYKYRAQDPTTLPNHSEPEPDFMIVTHKIYNRSTGHPKPEDALLVIEVADSSLSLDRTIKARAYALAEVKEYWIINLNDRKIEVYLNPSVTTGDYASINHYTETQTFDSPFNGPTVVAELLPEREPQEEE